MSSIEERVARGLTLATWIVGIIWIVASLVQVVVWLMILWIGGVAVTPFFGWTLGMGALLVVILLLLVFAMRGIARTTARTRPVDDAAPARRERAATARPERDAEDLL
jgi:Na+-transporting methylmalonyl-CoA/oxaloacetate decarboxylase gamma subunit